jgi:hypothetical protein
MRNFQLYIVLLVVLWLVVASASTTGAQSPDSVADLAARINHERITRGLVPLASSPVLSKSAQAHAEDVGKTTRYSHTGSDGSTATERIARAGYGNYSWGLRVGENWARYHSIADAMAAWMDSAPHRNNILHPVYREFGVGIAPTSLGGFVYVINFGAQPNVLPIFINNGAAETSSPNITLTLNSEEAMPAGDGANIIGNPTQVLVSNTPDFAGATWRSFATRLSWTLPPGGGKKTVYVKYRDAKGRTTTASDSIVLSVPTTPTLLPTRTATRTLLPTRLATTTMTPMPSETPTEIPTETPTPTFTLTTTITPTLTPAPTPIASGPVALDGWLAPLGLFAVLALGGAMAGIRFLDRR